MTPQLIWIALLSALVLGSVGAVVWAIRRDKGAIKSRAKAGSRGVNRRGTGSIASKSPVSPKVSNPSPSSQKSKSLRPVALDPKQLAALDRKYQAAKKRFISILDKRIFREKLIGDQLKRTRELVLGWYDQNGKVDRVRYVTKNSRTACKVCQGRHGKEYPLLDSNVIARILPPAHDDEGSRQECMCTVTPVLANEAQAAVRR